jgi:hypothetical protein
LGLVDFLLGRLGTTRRKQQQEADQDAAH